MRGHVRIRSERTPYRRAGLVFPQSREIEVSAIALVAAQLVTLGQDPALRVDAWLGDQYRPIGEIMPKLDEEHAEQLLEHLRKEAESGEEGAPAPAGGDDALKLATALGKLESARTELEQA